MAKSSKSGKSKQQGKSAAKAAKPAEAPAVAVDQPAAEAHQVPDVAALRWVVGSTLGDHNTRDKTGFDGDKVAGQAALAAGVPALSELQERLFAASQGGDKRRVLLVLQAMDTAGKGGIVRHVVGAVDPQGVEHVAFKAPTAQEQKHDFLWRIRRHVPGPGKIGVFDRSHYEDVLVHRVRELSPLAEVEKRYGAIVDFEKELAQEGITVIKVMLHISREEQGARLAERLERPDKFWKYNPSDLDDREYWDQYQDAYRIAMDKTSTLAAPWYVVPADRKWYARLAVQTLLTQALAGIDPQWPAADFDVEAEKKRLVDLG
ncbi:PPK2 family polyphosphate kinase [Galactobacter caseinivorans]|uniref:Polyphosphate kinase 2 family protein n=1 Tax=Galactobacter caseinivorans TaxID=2676123 RepID=A0A496PLW0_9MICC|nr:PPK2 family polyphosphate kinase [Galactobacter caseinivorans]RKW71528.1 polyphosphate kinase 2 family protein [Galactobacter caseinivorans]